MCLPDTKATRYLGLCQTGCSAYCGQIDHNNDTTLKEYSFLRMC
jgi:hypothetical protein